MINRDFSTEFISLIFYSKNNRLLYTIANVIFSFIISVIYSTIGIILLCIAKSVGVIGELKITFLFGFAANFIITILLYALICNLFKVKTQYIYYFNS